MEGNNHGCYQCNPVQMRFLSISFSFKDVSFVRSEVLTQNQDKVLVLTSGSECLLMRIDFWSIFHSTLLISSNQMQLITSSFSFLLSGLSLSLSPVTEE